MLIDSLQFSRDRQSACGTLPVARFERLHDSLFDAALGGDGSGDIRYEVSGVRYEVNGGADARDRPVLRVRVWGQFALQCQRCLKALDHELMIDTTLRLVPEESLDAEMSDDPDEADCIAASTELDLLVLIEDEILLALPVYPRHEDGSCGTSTGAAGAKKDSAFSVLSKLGTLKQ
jgi:uncharacterized protein